MKTIIKNQLILIALICSVGIYLSSCKKKDDTPPPTPPANGSLAFHLHSNVDTNEVDTLGMVYVMTGGRKISVSFAQLYISGIQLVKPDGSTYAVPGTIILKKQQTEPYNVGSVPAGNYTSVKFNIGLSAATNASTPLSTDTTLYVKSMWLDTGSVQPSGFVFINFQGKIDTTAAANGTIAQMVPFSYRIGTNAHLTSISMPTQNFTVAPHQTQYVHMIIDYAKLFSGVKLNTSGNLTINTASDNALPLATLVADSIPRMIHYE